ncbi:HK97 gp10 family phage protein [Aminipila sp.]|uniref:HK97 gp10 family phage protein n=1 Tax=Aminipila sp. TaxID=2060095 RepID=UPI00289A4919|nr:HK97 gp10 family phage protein [Aminipila sp.]
MSSNDDFVRSIEDATLQLIQQVKGNTRRACLFIESEAKKNCPLDQGPLRAAMFSQVNSTSTEIVGTVGNNSETAPYVHQGTGIYAVEGNGRRTPWKYKATGGKYKGWHVTRGQRAKPFLDKAKIDNRVKINHMLGGE